MLPQVVEPLLDFTSIESAGAVSSDRRCCPGSTDVSSDKMLFDTDQLRHSCVSFFSLLDLRWQAGTCLRNRRLQSFVTREPQLRCNQETAGRLCPLVPLWSQPSEGCFRRCSIAL